MASSSSMSAPREHEAIYETYRNHHKGLAISTRTCMLEALRNLHPNHHVTCIRKDEADFVGYAKTGKATITLESCDAQGIENFEAVREYVGPRRRLDDKQGHLEDSVKFGRYALAMDGHDFVLYNIAWTEGAWLDKVECWFILAPKEGATIVDGHHDAVDAMLLQVARWSAIPHDEIYVFDDSQWVKSSELWLSVQDASWEDVILEAKTKATLIDDVQGFFQNEELYHKFGVPWKRGIILHGVPGNGKTISIKALMNHLSSLEEGIPSLYVKSLDNKCNMPQYSVNEIFQKARKMAPCLLVFEDLDSLIVDKVRSYFLNEVDGLESNEGILMIGSTNHLNRLDPAISKRPSRFDRKYHFRIPDRAERIAYAEFWRNKLQKLPDASINFPEALNPLFADLTAGFSFAYMKELFVMSLLTVARGGTGNEPADETGWDVVSEQVSEQAPSDNDKEEAQTGGGDEDEDEKDTDAKEKEKKNKKAAKPKKQPRVVPVLNVPDELKDNVLLRVAQQQVRILLHEMDNTDEEETPDSLLAGGDSDESSNSMIGRAT